MLNFKYLIVKFHVKLCDLHNTNAVATQKSSTSKSTKTINIYNRTNFCWFKRAFNVSELTLIVLMWRIG